MIGSIGHSSKDTATSSLGRAKLAFSSVVRSYEMEKLGFIML